MLFRSVGVFDVKGASKIAYYALFAMQHRGQEATGISTSDGVNIHTHKRRGLVTDVFGEDVLSSLEGKIAVGHNRYSTAGSESVLDAQPVTASYKLGKISIVNNGNLINKNEVRAKLTEEGAIFQSSMDTENILHLIARSQEERLQDRIVEALHVIKGAYSLVILARQKMYAIRDKYGIRPLALGKFPDGGYIVASETCAFDLVGAEFVRDVKPGEMLIFEEASYTLGASFFQTFFKVILPPLFPALLTGFGLAFARGLGEYGSIIFISSNIPYVSEIVPLLIVTKLTSFDYAGASVVGVLMLIVAFIMLLVLNLIQKRFTKAYR